MRLESNLLVRGVSLNNVADNIGFSARQASDESNAIAASRILLNNCITKPSPKFASYHSKRADAAQKKCLSKAATAAPPAAAKLMLEEKGI